MKVKKLRLNRTKIISVFIILVIAVSGFIFATNRASASISVVEDGMKIDTKILYSIARFPGYDYVLRENWNVMINGEAGGKMQLLVPPGEDSSKGRTFAHGDTLWAWGAAMGGNPQYVRDTLSNVMATPIKRIDNGAMFKRYYSRDIAEEAGAFLTVKSDVKGTGLLEIQTTPFPTGTISVPGEAAAAKPFDVVFNGKEYEPFKVDKINWQLFVNTSLKDSGSASASAIQNKKVPITILGEGQHTVKLVLTDAIERSTTIEKKITVKKSVDGPIVTPDPEPTPDDNLPPTVKIKAPLEVKAGDPFCISADAADEDGTIEGYSWSAVGLNGELSDSDSCDVYYMEEGTKTVSVTVVDDKGSSASDSTQIKVVPPTPSARIDVEGALKENRKVTLNDNSSSPKMFPINQSITELTAMDGNETAYLAKPDNQGIYKEARFAVFVDKNKNNVPEENEQFHYVSSELGFNRAYNVEGAGYSFNMAFIQKGAKLPDLSTDVFEGSNIKAMLGESDIFVLVSPAQKFKCLHYESHIEGDTVTSILFIQPAE